MDITAVYEDGLDANGREIQPGHEYCCSWGTPCYELEELSTRMENGEFAELRQRMRRQCLADAEAAGRYISESARAALLAPL